jgi:hypothetical protein
MQPTRAINTTLMNASQQPSAENQPRICLILSFLGQWPPYSDLYLHSIRHNPDVNWLFVCDQPPPDAELPTNVRTLLTTKAELAQRIADTVGTPVNFTVPHKLCDFRPAFGLIFREELRGYDVWGHCDNDVIFGRVRRFFTAEILDSFEKVMIHGYMAFYRNSEVANSFYRLTTPTLRYQDIFADPRHLAFDEWPGIARVLAHHKIPYFQQELMATPAPWRFDLAPVQMHNYYPQAFVWDNGRVVRLYWDGLQVVETEVALLHLMRRKMKPAGFPVDASLRRFAILPDGFKKLSAMPSTPEELAALNPRRRGFTMYYTMLRPLRRLRKFFRERSLLKRYPPSQATRPGAAAQS